MRDSILRLASTGGGLGYLPAFPGTWGTLGVFALYSAALAAGVGADRLFVAVPAAAAGFSAAALLLGGRAESLFGRKDPGQFVLDEMAGFGISLSFLCRYSIWTGVAAFLLFRLLDIWKPWPIRRREGLRGGAGILLDDVAAGFLANLGIRFLGLFIRIL